MTFASLRIVASSSAASRPIGLLQPITHPQYFALLTKSDVTRCARHSSTTYAAPQSVHSLPRELADEFARKYYHKQPSYFLISSVERFASPIQNFISRIPLNR